MMKAIITDVDGVIVGKKRGVNFPLPNYKVIRKLKKIRAEGIPVVLCTAKSNFAILEIVKKANLLNPHIADGGALIIDPLNDHVIKKRNFDKKLAKDIVSACLNGGIYIECFGVEDCFIQKNQISGFTKKRIEILQKEYRAVPSLMEHATNFEVIKIIAFAGNEKDKQWIEKVLRPFMKDIHVIWTIHPLILPVQICIITVCGASKWQAAFEVLSHLKISPSETLGIGDTLGDWDFMSICKYVATVGNESNELKKLVESKGAGCYFYGSSVDNNGILEIFRHFIG